MKNLMKIIGTLYFILIMFLVVIMAIFGFFWCVLTEGLPFLRDMIFGVPEVKDK